MTTTANPHEIAKFAELSSTWWDTTGPLKTLHAINPARVAFMERHVSLRGLRILDAGCGGGILSEAMATRGAQVTGLDAEPGAIEAARAHANQSGLAIDYVAGTLEHFASEPFDAVTCMEMLEHVDNPAMVIAECAKHLRPGGTLFLSTLNRTPKAWAFAVVAAEYLLGLLPRQTHDFRKFIKPSALSEMVRASGLELVELSGMSWFPWNRHATLCTDVSVNYLLACRKA